MSIDETVRILELGSKERKIAMLESLQNSDVSEVIYKVISMLDDAEIEVRGEAFASLVLNENNISKYLISSLNSEHKNVRGFSALVLANRRNTEAISSITKLTKDESATVRSCALGALGYLNARQASKAIRSCFRDSNLEVKKSALKAAIDIGDKVMEDEIAEFTKENDPELEKLLIQIKQKS